MVVHQPRPDTGWVREQPRETGLLTAAALAAIAIHLILLSIDLPRRAEPPILASITQTSQAEPPELRKLPLPPPPHTDVREPRPAPRERRSWIALDDVTQFEPLSEAMGDIADSAAFDGVDSPLLIDAVPPPPQAGTTTPRLVTSEVSAPELIAESRIEPDYPAMARFDRVGGRVVLQAVIRESGFVDSVEVLGCTRPGYGLEESAIAAVEQWRYRPATLAGRPIAVYFTIVVDFSLQ